MSVAAKEDLRGYVRSFFRYEKRRTPSQWCEDELVLPQGKQETEPGKVSFKKRPYLREPIDAFADPTLTDIVFVGPTRIGKTFFLRMAFAYSVAGDPAPALWVDSTEDKGKDISRKELQPLVEANPILRDRKPKQAKNYTDTRMMFPAAALTIVGGNSDAQVAGDTVKRVFGNELDKWRGATDKEAAIAELVRHRTESFDDERKHGWSCTPTLEEMLTWQYHLRGDQRKWHCICQRCLFPQQLLWDRVWWDPEAKITETKWDLARVKSSARYRCVNATCTAHEGPEGWTDAERVAAITDSRAHWQATAVGEPGWRSYHLNGLYGPLKSNNVGALAVDFLSARNTGFFSDRQDFWNSRMGMPWRENVSEITTQKFCAREAVPFGDGRYFRGQLPAGFKPAFIIIGGDVQTNRIPFVVRACDLAGNSFTIDHGNAPTWKDLEQVQEDYRKLGGESFVIIDINFEDRRAETLEAIYTRKARGWLGAEGFELAKDLVRLEQANVYLGGKKQAEKHEVTKLVISTYQFKVELEKRFTGEIARWFSYQLPLAASEIELEEQSDYYKQLLDERRVPRKIRTAGKPAFEWKSRTGNNHAFDCEVYIHALLWVLIKTRSKAKREEGGVRKVVTVAQT